VFKEFDSAVGDQAVDSTHLPVAMTDGAVKTDFITDQRRVHRGARPPGGIAHAVASPRPGLVNRQIFFRDVIIHAATGHFGSAAKSAICSIRTATGGPRPSQTRSSHVYHSPECDQSVISPERTRTYRPRSRNLRRKMGGFPNLSLPRRSQRGSTLRRRSSTAHPRQMLLTADGQVVVFVAWLGSVDKE
jgi:hypothetical protein